MNTPEHPCKKPYNHTMGNFEDEIYGIGLEDNVVPPTCSSDVECGCLYNVLCNAIRRGYVITQVTDWGEDSWFLAVFSLFVCLANIYFASLILRNKSLQAHPMKLYMWIAVADSIYYSNQFFEYVCCKPFYLPYL